MFTDKYLRRRKETLTDAERAVLEDGVAKVVELPPRKVIVEAGETLSQSTLLVDGFMCRYIDDRNGFRQLVAVHVPGDFVDLHGYPLRRLDHDVAALTTTTVAIVPHGALDRIVEQYPAMARKLWYSTMIDAAVHRAWLFRLGRLDAGGRIAHFLCEMSARLEAVGLSDGRRFALGLTQADLAEICGLTSVHTNRVLRTLREENIVTLRSSQVEIHDPARLRRLGQFDAAYLYLDDTTPWASPVGNL
ncbi:Crp/Fnr family transcriptional regulator [Sphingomonas sp. Root710]|uniref:Crp/Fnr family transcriptional regulator n=1 Tax=Sphingomonas sp. Root710 TaxID=1736594 RepID=UPI0006FCB84C|nr:Crp/Fnr family transcriptional regulator [Sphingomonas sp. Root710]KRB86810.1 Crp/Fnr family transcriptional regulator [Sphingomonas sp. Root710]